MFLTERMMDQEHSVGIHRFVSAWKITRIAAAAGVLLMAAGLPSGARAPLPTPEQSAFFEKSVRPLLVPKCYECHGPEQARAGLRLDSLESLRHGGKSGPAIVLGQPDQSLLLRAVHYDGPVKMPPSGKLRAEEIAALTEWVKQGAHWPAAVAQPAAKTPDMVIGPAQRGFWSFQPVKRPALPRVKNTAWCVNPIDRFVLAKLEARGLKPAPAADRRTLIRRVSFDLIGLPPTPAEVDVFLSDRVPGAWQRLVDRLLASPNYGERWGRHWLDLVRYADSNGLDENVAMANAYRYRDYVVDAYNHDKPYDQFVREQLAGDLLPGGSPAEHNERLTATGFLLLGPKVLAEPDKDKMVMDIVDEQIEVTSKAFLGLTVACARCHNHKFDPIPTKDYYALAGIFKSTKSMATLNTVAMWQERPLTSKEAEAQAVTQTAALKRFENDLKAARQRAGDQALAEVRRNGPRYLLASVEAAASPDVGLVTVAGAIARSGDPAHQIIEAEKYNRGNAHRDTDSYGKGIGIIHTTEVPTWAEWDVNVPTAGLYQIELRYASAEMRPLQLSVNGKVVRQDAAGAATGSFFVDGQRWEAQGIYPFAAGKNVVRIESANSIPHIDKLYVGQADSAGGKAGRPLAVIAAEWKVEPELLRRSAAYFRAHAADPAVREVTVLAHAETKSRLAALEAKLTGGDPASAALAALISGKAGPLALPNPIDPVLKDEDRASIKKAEDALKMAQTNGPRPPMAMAVDEGTVEDCKVHIRGDTQSLGEAVPRHFLTVLDGDKIQADVKSSGRLELANWLTNPHNPLPARVEVNRIWQEHFGQGIVRTPDNYGLLGSPPTNPELLDWLASAFASSGPDGCKWSVKQLHRLMLLSNTYQMATETDTKDEELAASADPENLLLYKRPRRRMEAEPFRDALLSVSGKLDTTLGGTLLTTNNHDYVTNDQSGNAAQYNAPRRSLYLPIIRNAMFDMFQSFDVGDPSMVNAKRSTTTVASQALFVMNSPFVISLTHAWADRLLASPDNNDSARVRRAYLEAYSRPARSDEVTGALAYLTDTEQRSASAVSDPVKRRAQAWSSLCHILFASNEFIYIE